MVNTNAKPYSIKADFGGYNNIFAWILQFPI